MAFCQTLPTKTLCDSLRTLNRQPELLTSEETIAHRVLVEALCARLLEADAAFDAWAEADDPANPIATQPIDLIIDLIIEAALTAAKGRR